MLAPIVSCKELLGGFGFSDECPPAPANAQLLIKLSMRRPVAPRMICTIDGFE